MLLLLISGIVLVALKPPSLRIASPQELFNVDHKPITDGLSKLPATYDGVRPDKKTDAGKAPEPVVPGVPSIDGAGQRSRWRRRSGSRRLGLRAWPARPAKSRCSSAWLSRPRRGSRLTAEVRPDLVPRPAPRRPTAI